MRQSIQGNGAGQRRVTAPVRRQRRKIWQVLVYDSAPVHIRVWFVTAVTSLDVAAAEPGSQTFIDLSRSALPMTLTDDSAMAAAAMTGDSSRPNTG